MEFGADIAVRSKGFCGGLCSTYSEQQTKCHITSDVCNAGRFIRADCLEILFAMFAGLSMMTMMMMIAGISKCVQCSWL